MGRGTLATPAAQHSCSGVRGWLRFEVILQRHLAARNGCEDGQGADCGVRATEGMEAMWKQRGGEAEHGLQEHGNTEELK